MIAYFLVNQTLYIVQLFWHQTVNICCLLARWLFRGKCHLQPEQVFWARIIDADVIIKHREILRSIPLLIYSKVAKAERWYMVHIQTHASLISVHISTTCEKWEMPLLLYVLLEHLPSSVSNIKCIFQPYIHIRSMRRGVSESIAQWLTCKPQKISVRVR